MILLWHDKQSTWYYYDYYDTTDKQSIWYYYEMINNQYDTTMTW